MALTKPAGPWTYQDLFSLPDEKRYEIVEGELCEMPAPTSVHAIVIANLITMLIPLVARLGGRWFTAPIDVFVPGGDPVQPDILVIFPGGPARVVLRGIEGAPDLVVEVLSPSNRAHDLLTKRALYGRAGVREYWIIDPEARTIEMFVLDGDALHSTGLVSGADVPVSPLFGPLPLAADEIFAGIEE